MTLAQAHPLTPLRHRLEAIASEADSSGLQELLEAKGLPVLGGDPHPADLINRSLTLSPIDSELTTQISLLAARLAGHASQPHNEALFQLALLVSGLPRNETLFGSLVGWLNQTSPLDHAPHTWRQMLAALAQQQTDDRLAEFWMRGLETASDSTSVTEARALLLAAWRGLLWMPSEGRPGSSRSLAPSWLAKILLGLDQATSAFNHREKILLLAMTELKDAYPRSDEFWGAQLKGLISRFSDDLLATFHKVWPGITFQQRPDPTKVSAAKVSSTKVSSNKVSSTKVSSTKAYGPKTAEINPEWFVVDAAGLTLSRLASRVANTLRGKHNPVYTPQGDSGEFVVVINAEKVLLTGRKGDRKVYQRHGTAGLKEQTARELRSKKPERMIELAVRGMLPKNRLGRSLQRKLKIFRGSEHPFQTRRLEAAGAPQALGDHE